MLILFLAGLGHGKVEENCESNLWSEDRRKDVGSGPTDHWPTVDNAEACKLQHCSREMVSELN